MDPTAVSAAASPTLARGGGAVSPWAGAGGVTWAGNACAVASWGTVLRATGAGQAAWDGGSGLIWAYQAGRTADGAS